MGRPRSRAYRLGIIPLRGEVAIGIDRQRQLGQRPGGRSRERPSPIKHIERGLVAGAEQLFGFRLIERDRASRMGAHLEYAR